MLRSLLLSVALLALTACSSQPTPAPAPLPAPKEVAVNPTSDYASFKEAALEKLAKRASAALGNADGSHTENDALEAVQDFEHLLAEAHRLYGRIDAVPAEALAELEGAQDRACSILFRVLEDRMTRPAPKALLALNQILGDRS
jgi:hypothetical protein